MADIPIFAIILMILLSIGMFLGQALYKKKGNEGGKILSIVCGICIVITAVYVNIFKSDDNPQQEIEKKKIEFKKVQSVVLANTLANKYEGVVGKCLLIHYPIQSKDARMELDSIIEGLQSGFGGRVAEIRPVPILDKIRQANSEDFNLVLSANSDCDVIISLASLPYNIDDLLKINIFTLIKDDNGDLVKDPGIKYPLVGVDNEHIGFLDFLIEEELIHAMTVLRPKAADDNGPIPNSVQEAFDKKFILITPETIHEVHDRFPQMFPK